MWLKAIQSLKEDGSEFDNEDLRAINWEVRPLACQLAEEADLSYYQASYDDKNKRVDAPTPEAQNLSLQSVSTPMPLTLNCPPL